MEKKIDKDFIRNLTRMRLSKGLSVQELAEKAGLSRQIIYNYESGNAFPKVEALAKLSKALNCEKADFFKAE